MNAKADKTADRLNQAELHQQVSMEKMRDVFGGLMQDPQLGQFFAALSEMFGLGPKTMEGLQDDVFSNIYKEVTNGAIDFDGTKETVKRSIEEAVNDMVAKGEIQFTGDQKQQYIQDLQKAIDGFDGSLMDRKAVLEAPRSSGAAEYLDTLRLPKVDEAVFDHSSPVQQINFSEGLSVKGAGGKDLFSFKADEQGHITAYSLEGSTTQEIALTMERDLSPEMLREALGKGFSIEAVAHQDFDADAGNAKIIGYHVESADGSASFYIGPQSVALVDAEKKVINVDFTQQLKEGLEADAKRDRSPDLEVKPSADVTLEQAQQLEQQRISAGISGPSVALPN